MLKIPDLSPEDSQTARDDAEEGKRLAFEWFDAHGGGQDSLVVLSCAAAWLLALCLADADGHTCPSDDAGFLITDKDRLGLHFESIQLYAAIIRAAKNDVRGPHGH